MIKGTKLFKVTGLTNVDPKAFNQYDDWKNAIENNTFADIEKYKEKAKANYRWMLISMNLNKGLETLSNIKINGGSSSDVPGSVDFIVTYTQPDALWVKDGENYIQGGDAIKKIIEDTLNQEYNVILTYFSPKTINKENESTLAKGTVMEELTVEAKPVSVSVEELLEYSHFEE